MLKKFFSTLFVCCILFIGCSKNTEVQSLEIQDGHFNMTVDQFPAFLENNLNIPPLSNDSIENDKVHQLCTFSFNVGKFQVKYTEEGFIQHIIAINNPQNNIIPIFTEMMSNNTNITDKDWQELQQAFSKNALIDVKNGESFTSSTLTKGDFNITIFSGISTAASNPEESTVDDLYCKNYSMVVSPSTND